MAVCIRPARESDADDIARLTAQLGYDVATSALRPRLSRLLARSEQQLLMAEVDGRAAGWLHAAVFEDIEAEPFVVIGRLVVDATSGAPKLLANALAITSAPESQPRCDSSSAVCPWKS